MWIIQQTQINGGRNRVDAVADDDVDNNEGENVNDEEVARRNLPQEHDEEGYHERKPKHHNRTSSPSLQQHRQREMNSVVDDVHENNNRIDIIVEEHLQEDHQHQEEERYHHQHQDDGEDWNTESVQALLEIILTFYQVAYAMRVRTAFRIKHFSSLLIDILTIPATLIIDLPTKLVSLCLIHTNDAISIEFMRVGPLIMCLTVVVILIVILKVSKYLVKRHWRAVDDGMDQPLIHYHRIDANTPRFGDDGVRMPVELRLHILYLTLLTTVSYLPFSMFLLKLFNCISIDDYISVTVIQASVICFSRLFQTAALLIFIFCVLPLPVVLYISTKRLQQFKITPNQFMLTTLFPPLLLLFCFINGGHPAAPFTHSQAATAYHLIETIIGPYRYSKVDNDEVNHDDEVTRLSWKPITMLRCCIISVISVMILGRNNLFGLLFASVALVVFAIHDSRVKPYNSVGLNMASSCRWLVLVLMVVVNLYWLFTGVVNVEENVDDFNSLTILGKVLLFIELLVLLVPVFLVMLRVLIFLVYKYLSKYFENLIKKND